MILHKLLGPFVEAVECAFRVICRHPSCLLEPLDEQILVLLKKKVLSEKYVCLELIQLGIIFGSSICEVELFNIGASF